MITIVGLGAGDFRHLTVAGWEAIQGAEKLLLRTRIHPVVAEMERRGVAYQSFDGLYEEAADFASLYEEIAARVLGEGEQGPVVYAVPGHPLVAETTVTILLEEARKRSIPVEVLPGLSFLEAVYIALGVDPNKGLTVLDGLRLDELANPPGTSALITQVYDRRVASDIKLTLTEQWGIPDEFPVTVLRAVGIPGEERIEEHPLYEIDRLDWLDHLTTLYLPPWAGNSSPYSLAPLVDVLKTLLGPEGCPWDREQTHQSLKPYLVEETYEVLEAIDEGDMYKVREELGDLLLQVVFHGALAEESGAFDLQEVVEGITEKMIRRHPHVFGQATVNTAGDVVTQWEAIKAIEKGEANPSVLKDLPKGLPALTKSYKLQAKAAKVGFDWPDISGAWNKVEEELAELREACRHGEQLGIQDELGDLLFAVVNVARYLQVDPEEALNGTIRKFVGRFRHVEERARETGKSVNNYPLEVLDQWWEEAKNKKVMK